MERYCLVEGYKIGDPMPCPLLWEGIENFHKLSDEEKGRHNWYKFIINFDIPIYNEKTEYISGTQLVVDHSKKTVTLCMEVSKTTESTLEFLEKTKDDAMDILEELLNVLERRGLFSPKELSRRSQSILVARRKVKNNIPRNIEVIKIKEEE